MKKIVEGISHAKIRPELQPLVVEIRKLANRVFNDMENESGQAGIIAALGEAFEAIKSSEKSNPEEELEETTSTEETTEEIPANSLGDTV